MNITKWKWNRQAYKSSYKVLNNMVSLVSICPDKNHHTHLNFFNQLDIIYFQNRIKQPIQQLEICGFMQYLPDDTKTLKHCIIPKKKSLTII